jgi:hypothetical protein
MGRYIVAAALLAAIAGPAFAQQSMPDDPIVLDAIQKQKDREALDKQYKATLKNTDQSVAPVKTDPWSNMRGSDNSKTKR